MLHIIFAILKIVLLILAAVLGIALWILALLLLIPVRYEAHVKKKEEFFVEAKVHWLLHLVRVPVELPGWEAVGEAEGAYSYREGFSGG